jgi:hypothetical protein
MLQKSKDLVQTLCRNWAQQWTQFEKKIAASSGVEMLEDWIYFFLRTWSIVAA